MTKKRRLLFFGYRNNFFWNIFNPSLIEFLDVECVAMKGQLCVCGGGYSGKYTSFGFSEGFVTIRTTLKAP